MKKILAIIIAAAMLTVVFGGCSARDNIVSTDGSTSMERVIGFLAESYMEENHGIKVTFNPTGSGAGIQAVLDRRCDIGLSSRALSPEEAESLKATVVAIDGIAVIVNPQNPISDLSLETLSKVYKGEITNWKDIGGHNAPIVPIGREAASGTREGFEAVTETENACRYSQELTSTGDIVQTVASNPNAIGYASLASVKENVKLLSVDGIRPTIETIQSGEYKIRRDFMFVTKKDAPLSETAQKFFDYATGASVDELIVGAGAIPLKR